MVTADTATMTLPLRRICTPDFLLASLVLRGRISISVIHYCARTERRIAAASGLPCRLLLPVGRARDVGDGDAVVDRLAADVLGLSLRFRRVEHFEHDVARDEAHPGIVGDHEVAGRHPHLADMDRSVDLHRLEPPLAG